MKKKEAVTSNQISNMANIHQSLLESVKAEDLIYFVEDDYLHNKDCLEEMIFAYEKISTHFWERIPFYVPVLIIHILYSKFENKNYWETNITGEKVLKLWCTFLTSKKNDNKSYI